MELTVREIEVNEIEKVIDYFLNADAEFLKGMGADKSKLPARKEWIDKRKAGLGFDFLKLTVPYYFK